MPDGPETPAFSPTLVTLADIFCTEAYFQNLVTLSQLSRTALGREERRLCCSWTPASSVEGWPRPMLTCSGAEARPVDKSPVSTPALALLVSVQGSSQRKEAPLASSPLRRGRNEAALLVDIPGSFPRPCGDHLACAAHFVWNALLSQPRPQVLECAAQVLILTLTVPLALRLHTMCTLQSLALLPWWRGEQNSVQQLALALAAGQALSKVLTGPLACCGAQGNVFS